MAIPKFASGLVIALALLSSPAASRAQAPDPEAVSAARELIALTLGDELQEKLVEQTWPALEPVIRRAAPKLSAGQMAGLKAEYVRLTNEDMTGLMAGMPELYARHFTASELRDVLAFYRTPTGRKTIQAMPALYGEIMKLIMPQMPAMVARMKESFGRILSEKGITLPAHPR